MTSRERVATRHANELFNAGLRLAGPEAAYVVQAYATYYGWDEKRTRFAEIAKPEEKRKPARARSPDQRGLLDAILPEAAHALLRPDLNPDN
jgi:hypothetical protein